MKRSCLVAVLVLVVASFAGPTFAQTDEEHFQTFPFNFSTPGARPMAMGGAFIGRARDASAAVTNPAGLSFLTSRQVYLEFKDVYQPVARLDQPDSLLTGQGTYTGPRLAVPSFFNLAVPVGSKLTVAVSANEFLKYKDDTVNLPERRSITNSQWVFPASTTSNLNFQGIAFLGSIAARVDDRVSVGGSVSLQRLSGTFNAVRGCTAVLKTSNCALTATVPNTSMNDASMGVGLNAGILYKASDSLSIGVTAAKSPQFALDEQVGQAAKTVYFNVPDRFGAGLSWQPGVGRYVFVLDVDRVLYSQMTNDMQIIYYSNWSTAGCAAPGCVPFQKFTSGTTSTAAPTASDFYYKNATEVHAGMEIKLNRDKNSASPFFLRYGVFTNPSHTIRSKGEATTKGFVGANGQILDPNGYYPGTLPAELLQSFTYGVVGVPPCTTAGGQTNCASMVPMSGTDVGISVGGGYVLSGRASIDLAFVASRNQRQDFVVSVMLRPWATK